MDKDVLIQKYLKGKLTPTEESQFQKYMEEDPSFAASVPFLEEVHYAFAKADYDTTKAQLENFHKEVRRKNWRSWSVAATVLVLIGLGSLFFLTTESSGEALYAAHFEPYKNVVQPTVRSEGTQTTKTQAFMAYDEGDYKKAIAYMDELLADKPDATISLYRANALLQIGQTRAAIAALEFHIEKTDTVYAEAQWYLGLGYLKIDEIALAKQSFNTLLQTESTFKRDTAQQLLEQLE